MTSATDDPILRQDMPQALHKGTSINLVDRFLVPFHSHFYQGLCSKMVFWLNSPPSTVHVVYGCPLKSMAPPNY